MLARTQGRRVQYNVHKVSHDPKETIEQCVVLFAVRSAIISFYAIIMVVHTCTCTRVPLLVQIKYYFFASRKDTRTKMFQCSSKYSYRDNMVLDVDSLDDCHC